MNWKINNGRYKYKSYDSPLSEVVSMIEEINFMGSDGGTENYGNDDPWDIPDND